MFLKKTKEATPDAARTGIDKPPAMGTTPGQRIIGYMTAFIGAGLILGSVFYYRVYPHMNASEDTKPTPKSGETAPAPAPKLNVPLDLNGSAEPAPTAPNTSVPPIGEASGGRALPPGMVGGRGGSTPAAQAMNEDSNPEIDNARQRKLAGDLGSFGPSDEAEPTAPAESKAPSANAARPTAGITGLQTTGSTSTALSAMLVPTTTPGTSASYMPNQHLTLAKGTSISCTLDTAIQTDQVGFVSCLTDYPIRSMDGKTVLAERGTKIEGEYAKGVERGMRSVFILWTRARTPEGVIIPLASPGTDPLGRAGVPGQIDNKFWDRFGGALMFSMLQDASTAAASNLARKDENGRDVIVMANTQKAGESAIGEVLKQGSDIKPSLYKNQGDLVAITVARDIDFSTVYRLTASAKVQ